MAPLLTSSESHYSTYWTKNDVKEDEFDDRYFSIYDRQNVGCFKVLGVQECFLVDLNDQTVVSEILNVETDYRVFQDYSDDMWFSHNANLLSKLYDLKLYLGIFFLYFEIIYKISIAFYSQFITCSTKIINAIFFISF